MLTAVDAPYLNLSQRKTRGYDLEVSYQRPLGTWFDLTLRGLASYVDTLTTLNPGAPEIESAGQTGRPGTGRYPESRRKRVALSTAATVATAAFVQLRYIDDGINDMTLLPTILDPAQNRVASVTYTDLTLTQRIGNFTTRLRCCLGRRIVRHRQQRVRPRSALGAVALARIRSTQRRHQRRHLRPHRSTLQRRHPDAVLMRALVWLLFAAIASMAQASHADTVMITGANSGLGLELARQYAKAGWTVIAVHRRDTTLLSSRIWASNIRRYVRSAWTSATKPKFARSRAS